MTILIIKNNYSKLQFSTIHTFTSGPYTRQWPEHIYTILLIAKTQKLCNK